ncbi:MAG TPA: LysE family translocator [Gaiellaceae bacterium]|nr:LysE family translocator [Gaiellaceae bacterium]
MPALSTLAVFCAAGLALIVVPGPAVTYIVTQSIDKGRRAGLVSALGIAAGGLVHVTAAVLGLSALIASSASAFTVVKLVGAAYLVVLGVRRLLSNDDVAVPELSPEPAEHSRLFVQGVVVNILNPKTALFFLAFLPQFVDPNRGSVALQAAILGTIFVAMAVVSDSSYAVAAAALSDRLRNSVRARRIQRWVSGTIFVALGATAALAKRS